MSEAAEKTAADYGPQGSAQREPGTGSEWGHLKLLALAGFGATFGFMTGWGLWSEVQFHSIEFALVVVPLAIGGYVLFDPIQKWFEGRGEPERKRKRHQADSSERPTILAVGCASLGALVVAAFHHSLDSAVVEDFTKFADERKNSNDPAAKILGELAKHLTAWGQLEIALVAIGIVIAALAITHFWVQGVRREPPRAAQWGTAAALVSGLLVIAVAVAVCYYHHKLDYYRLALVGGGLGVLLWFVVPGLSGGLAIHKLPSGSSPTSRIFLYLGAASGIYVLVLLFAASFLRTRYSAFSEIIGSLTWLAIVGIVCQNLGWALGPLFRPKFCDPHLCRTGVIDPPETPFGGVVGPRLVLSRPSSPGPVAPLRPKEPPRRSGLLWGSVAFVLSVVVALVLYYLGTLRPVQDITWNIQRNFQKDSGLQSKNLNVHANGNTVTLTGVVDNQFEHEKALEQASAVRGVRQIIDQIQVAPPPPPPAPAPVAMPPIIMVPAQPQQPAINATVSIQRPGSSGAGVKKTAKPQQQPQKHSFLSNLKDNAQNAAQKASTQNSSGAKPTMQPQASNEQKHKGFFHFLKRDKNNKTKKASGQ